MTAPHPATMAPPPRPGALPKQPCDQVWLQSQPSMRNASAGHAVRALQPGATPGAALAARAHVTARSRAWPPTPSSCTTARAPPLREGAGTLNERRAGRLSRLRAGLLRGKRAPEACPCLVDIADDPVEGAHLVASAAIAAGAVIHDGFTRATWSRRGPGVDEAEGGAAGATERPADTVRPKSLAPVPAAATDAGGSGAGHTATCGSCGG